MSRKPSIKWRESDAEKLEKKVARFNAKIYRTKRSHPELADILPNTIKKADKEQLIQKFKEMPRSEFNKKLTSLERFSVKGAEKEIVSKTGNRVTKWEKKEVGLKVAQVNRAKTVERKAVEQMEATSRGESLGMKRGEMGSERLNELKPKKFNFDKIRGGKEWEKFKESVDKLASPEARNERMETYKKNYITGVERVYGDYAKDLINMLKEIPAEDIVKMYYSEQEATITFHYDPQEMQTKLDIITNIWTPLFEEYQGGD